MKALQFEKYGKAEEVLSLTELPEPEPGDGEVKVKMLMSPINPSDIYNTIEGTYGEAVSKTIWNFDKSADNYSIDPEGERTIPNLPHVPGLEGVGIVVKAGKGLRGKMLLGKRVTVVGAKKGNWQEYTIADAKTTLPVSKYLTDEQAATSFVNPVTAFVMIRKVLNCKKGDVLLQSAANSELGKMVIRLGKEYGFTTINLIRNKEQAAHLKNIGADHVIDITEKDIKQKLFEITGGKGANYALDPIGGELASRMLQCLGIKGHMLVYGTLTREPLVFSPRDLMTPITKLEGFFLTNWMADKSIISKLMIIRSVGKLIKKGVLQSEIGPVFSIEDYKEAFKAVNEPNNKGKVLLQMSKD